MGIKYRATTSDAIKENMTVRAMSPKIWPATPSTKTMGKKTDMVVSVEATTAPPTSETPLIVDLTKSSPSSRQRKMLSSTTMELSTSIPTPRANPPRDMILRDTPDNCMGAKVAKMDTGIVIPMIAV